MSHNEYKSKAKELLRLLRTEKEKMSPQTVERIQGWIVSGDSSPEKEREFEALFEELVRYRIVPSAKAFRMNRRWKKENGIGIRSVHPLYRPVALRIAVVVIPVLIVSGWFVWNPPESRVSAGSLVCMNVPDAPDAHCRAELADGTDILIRPGTTVSYAGDLGTAQTRRVVLDRGEICLDVAEDGARRFVVETPWLDVNVLGTWFDVDTDSERTVVTLYRGRVEVEGIGGKEGSEASLNPGERLVCDNATGEYRIERTESPLPEWIARKLTFRAATHGEIMRTIEWFYGIEFEVDGGLRDDVRLDFRFTGREDIQTAMWLFQKVSREFTYEITPAQVRIKTKN